MSVADFYLALVGEKRVVDIYFCLVSFSVSGVTGKSQDFHRKSFRYTYLSKREAQKNKKRKKRETRQLSFLFSFFISLLGKKEYTHTQQHKHARFREVKRER